MLKLIQIKIKALRLDFSNNGNQLTGQIINLISNDVGRLETAPLFVGYLLIGPIQAIIVIFILLYLTNFSFVIGLSLLCVFLPLQSIASKIYDKLRYYCIIQFLQEKSNFN